MFEHVVQVWDLETRKLLSQFETVFSFGGHRLAIAPLGDKCVAAAWKAGKRGGVACYHANTGEVIWHRTDLKQTQRVRFSRDGTSLWCVPEKGPTKRLDSQSGKTLDSITGLEDIFESEHSSVLLLEKRKRDYVLRSATDCQLPRLTFAILDVAFAPNSLLISESGGPARCFNSSTGIEMWRHSPGNQVHFLKMWYRETNRSFYGVAWDFQTGSFRSLARLGAHSGEHQVICQLDSWEEAYCSKLDALITSGGEILALSDGKPLHRLQFPETNYPDKRHSPQFRMV